MVLSAIPAGDMAEPFGAWRARELLSSGRAVVLGGGTGNPFDANCDFHGFALLLNGTQSAVLEEFTKIDRPRKPQSGGGVSIFFGP